MYSKYNQKAKLTTAHLTPMPAPKASNCSAIWIASSLEREKQKKETKLVWIETPFLEWIKDDISNLPCWGQNTSKEWLWRF